MDKAEEDKAIADVTSRLRDRFPQIEPTTVDHVVSDFHHEYDGRPIRDFVPVLVEREAREHLAGIPTQRAAPDS